MCVWGGGGGGLGDTPLHAACKNVTYVLYDEPNRLTSVIIHGACEGLGDTPLHAACKNGTHVLYDEPNRLTSVIIQKLLKAGANPSLQNKFGETALFQSAFSYPEHMPFLLDHGANPTITNSLSETALFRGHSGHRHIINTSTHHNDGVIEMLVEVCPLQLEDVYMNKGPKRVRVWRLWHCSSPPGRVRRRGLVDWSSAIISTLARYV